jgi:hypothetical protein
MILLGGHFQTLYRYPRRGLLYFDGIIFDRQTSLFDCLRAFFWRPPRDHFTGLQNPFLLHTAIDLLMTRHELASAHRFHSVSIKERSLQQIKCLLVPTCCLCFLVVSSGPVTLDIRPLSDYQMSLIDASLTLRSSGWSDRLIPNHFK